MPLKSTLYSSTNNLVPINDDYSLAEESCDDLAKPGLLRTPLLLIDYIQFLAARSIQRHWRGFHFRHKWAKTNKAATVIQAAWRGYWVRKTFHSTVETKLQDMLIYTYNRAATKIQALYRGWQTRRIVHDSYGLRKLQSCAAQELLFCVAYKLHHMMRTYQIPGIYSLRNSHCLSRVEQLLLTTRYRFLNTRVMQEMSQHLNVKNKHYKDFKKSQYNTQVPYRGPDYSQACKPNCIRELRKSKDIDKRMHKIIMDYHRSVNYPSTAKVNRRLTDNKNRRAINKILQRSKLLSNDFCGDVIMSMRRWSIFGGKHLTIDKDVFRNIEKLEQFLDECFDILDNLNNCHCKMPVYDVVICH